MTIRKRLVLLSDCGVTCSTVSLELRGTFEVFISQSWTLLKQLPARVASTGRPLWAVPALHQPSGEMGAGGGGGD